MTISENFEYKVLPMQFYIFTLSGVWCPKNWKESFKTLYSLYTSIQIVAGILFWLSMLINIIITKTESDYFYENIFGITTLTFAMYKEYFILRKRRKIEYLMKLCLEDEWFEPKDDDEVKIIENCRSEIRWITQLYAYGIAAGLATKAITPMLKSNSDWILPMEAWYPYDTNNLINYLLSYVQQLLGGIPLICLHISVDTLFVGLVLGICIQLKLLKHRLRSYAYFSHQNEKQLDGVLSDSILSTYANKHSSILQLGKTANTTFNEILTGQVIITIPNICINVYLLSQFEDALNVHVLDAFLCFGTCLMEICLYCWYGNTIILQSLDVINAVYDMNWTQLSVSGKKKVLTIMVRTTRSIRFSAGTFVMNISSFLEILKISYSAFRLLQNI